MAIVENSQLGKETNYLDRYAPEVLFPIARSESRASLGIEDTDLPFAGEDVWTSFEVSWLNNNGKPEVAIGVFSIPCQSKNIIESKSFKLYLNSFNQEKIESKDALIETLEQDLSTAAGAAVTVQLHDLVDVQAVSLPAGESVDHLDAKDFVYEPNADLLQADSAELVEETLYSDLLRSNCPVTGQPDWGTVVVSYKGPKIDRESLLRYVVSFRNCQDFHEHCCEQIFTDILAKCGCTSLSVMARYTRRGGLDINPYRATEDRVSVCPQTRYVRQ